MTTNREAIVDRVLDDVEGCKDAQPERNAWVSADAPVYGDWRSPFGTWDKPKTPLVSDPVNNPVHYNQGAIETIDFIEQVVAHYPPEVAYHIGALLKYVSRAPHKGKMTEDLRKAEWYFTRALKHFE